MLLHGENSGSKLIQDGDLVVVYERFDSMKAVQVTLKGTYGNKFGNFALKDWIGKPFGSKMRAKLPSTGWVYVLAPTPELWTQVLRHRTQILYVADISMVCTMLELHPGCTVLESGTGSGSLTTSLARAVAPSGHVYTFEFHEQRAATAAEEFKQNGLGDVITVAQRDIEGQGFPEALHGRADALFLDLPGPWKVVPSAAKCLRSDGVFCSFSPCIEQVQRTCEALNAHGFRQMHTMEVLLRQYEVTTEHLIAELGGGTPPAPKGKPQQQPPQQQQGGEGAANSQQPAKRARTDQPGPAAEAAAAAAAAATQAATAPQQDAEAVVGEQGEQAPPIAQEQQGGDAQEPGQPAATPTVVDAGGVNGGEGGAAWNGGAQGSVGRGSGKERRVMARPVAQGRGHTGYLTFARKAVL